MRIDTGKFIFEGKFIVEVGEIPSDFEVEVGGKLLKIRGVE